jgi:spore maturation protein SpmA
MPTPPLVFVMLGFGIAGGMAQAAVLPAVLQMMSPNHLRAQITALYFLIQNLISVGLGPTVIALLTDYGFKDPSALRYSMVVVAAVGMVSATVMMAIGAKPVTAALRGRLPGL